MTENSTIAAMPLYTNLDRVARGLSALGIGPKDPIPPERLFALDQWHYHGTEAVRAAAGRAPFSAADLRDVRDVVFGISMTSIEDYANDLRSAGFVDVETTDLTGDWSPYAAERLKKWRANHKAYARVHGEGAYAAQEKFYAIIAHLYESGSLGGVRLIAKVPD